MIKRSSTLCIRVLTQDIFILVEFSFGFPNFVSQQKLCSAWKKQLNEEVEESHIFVIDVERVLQIEDYGEVWFIFNQNNIYTLKQNVDGSMRMTR